MSWDSYANVAAAWFGYAWPAFMFHFCIHWPIWLLKPGRWAEMWGE